MVPLVFIPDDSGSMFSTLSQAILNELWLREGRRFSGSCSRGFFFNAVPPEGPKDHSRPNIHFQPFSEISSDCRVMMLCTADDEIFYVEEHYSETQFFADL